MAGAPDWSFGPCLRLWWESSVRRARVAGGGANAVGERGWRALTPPTLLMWMRKIQVLCDERPWNTHMPWTTPESGVPSSGAATGEPPEAFAFSIISAPSTLSEPRLCSCGEAQPCPRPEL